MVKYLLSRWYPISRIPRIIWIVIVCRFSRSTRNIYTENLRQATASDSYILRGDLAGEVYEPTYEIYIIHSE